MCLHQNNIAKNNLDTDTKSFFCLLKPCAHFENAIKHKCQTNYINISKSKVKQNGCLKNALHHWNLYRPSSKWYKQNKNNKGKKSQIQCNYNHYRQRQPIVIMDTAITSKKLIASYLIKTVTKHFNQIPLYNIVKSWMIYWTNLKMKIYSPKKTAEGLK